MKFLNKLLIFITLNIVVFSILWGIIGIAHWTLNTDLWCPFYRFLLGVLGLTFLVFSLINIFCYPNLGTFKHLKE